MLKEGFSIELAKIVKSNYLEYIDLLDSLRVNDDIIVSMTYGNS
jgi:hypothetical protein